MEIRTRTHGKPDGDGPARYRRGVNPEFPRILTGLMANRALSRKALAVAVGLAESSINRLAGGMTAPTAAVLQDIAPVLQVPVADLLVIAGLPTAQLPPAPAVAGGIADLVAVASGLTPEQLQQVTALARQLKEAGPG